MLRAAPLRFVSLAALIAIAVDLGAVVLTGGVSVLGPVGALGFAVRLGLALALLSIHYLAVRGSSRAATTHAYVALLLVLLPVLHFRGYRLRGDGLWYYSFAHSVAFDGDVDLENQYRSLGIDHLAGSQPVRETGRARYTYPVGAPLSWVPFLHLGHAGAWLREAHGLPTERDGFSDPYFHAVALGSLVVGWLGLLVLHRVLRRWFPEWIAFWATASVGLGTFLAWYLAYHSIYTHALTFTLVALFLKQWLEERDTLAHYGTLGLLLGLAGCVRWQNGIFALLPAWSLGRRILGGEAKPALRSGAAFAGAFALGLLPQLVSWKLIFDRFYIGVPLGADYVRWLDPFVTETLFSSRHGLFSWSPLLILAALGLPGFLRREPRAGVPLVGVAVLLAYVNSSVADWWAGGSFGARRFDSVLPILALGLATSLSALHDLVRRHPRAVAAAVPVLFIAGNALLMEQYRKGRIPVDDTLSWQQAAEGSLEDVFDLVGYPFSFPMNWMFALRYDRPWTQYDVLVGKYLFHRMNNLQGVVDLGVRDPPFLGNGWSGVRDWKDRPREIRLAEGPRAGLFVPTDRAETLRVFIECAAPAGVEPAPVEIWLNGFRIGGIVPGAEMEEKAVTADARLWRRINLLEFVPASGPPSGPYLAVDRLRFERLEQR